jgi:manganese transport protein
VMHFDILCSLVIYTFATVAFYLLGATVLHAKGLLVENARMIETLSVMYREVFGEWSVPMFLIGAFAVLYSTIFGATASNSRTGIDALALWRVKNFRDEAEHTRWVKYGCVVLPVAFTSVFIFVGSPVSLVFVGAVGQGLMLPFIAGAALYLHFKNPHRDLRAGKLSLGCLIAASLLMAALGAYQVINEVGRMF